MPFKFSHILLETGRRMRPGVWSNRQDVKRSWKNVRFVLRLLHKDHYCTIHDLHSQLPYSPSPCGHFSVSRTQMTLEKAEILLDEFKKGISREAKEHSRWCFVFKVLPVTETAVGKWNFHKKDTYLPLLEHS